MKQLTSIIRSKGAELVLMLSIISVSAFVHGWNMYRFPYFENDEGTYFTRAWTLISTGKLDAYTYWYDHSPFGWMFTSIWLFLTGGPFRFGFSLFSARLFTFLIHIAITWLLYKVSKKITESTVASVIACMFFALSPLAVYFQRRFLLDNILVFWIMVSLYLILYSRQRLSYFIFSAIAFGIAVLSKENGIFFFPAFVWLVAREAHPHNRLFAVVKWTLIAGIIVSFYPTYALLKGELFPTGSPWATTQEHVSLLGTLKMQAARGANLPFWKYKSDFMVNFRYWLHSEPVFVIIGFCSFLLQGISALFSRRSRTIFFITACIMAFFLSGKLVINFYVIALIPFLGMCAGLTIAQCLAPLSRIHPSVYALASMMFIGIIVWHYAQSPDFRVMLQRDDTKYQLEAVEWIKKNIDDISFISTDYYANLDLTESRFPGDPSFRNADWYWKLDFDTDIRKKKLQNNFKNVQYIMLTNQMFRDINAFDKNTSLLRNALNNSSIVKLFASEDTSSFEMPQFPQNHPNGDWVAIMKQNTAAEVLTRSWEGYKQAAVQENGMTAAQGVTSASIRDQSYTMLRAALMGDRHIFDRSFTWTKDHMKLKDKYLFATAYDGKITNPGTTTEADEDIAYALLVAAGRWNNATYKDFADKMINDIWKYETATVKSVPYIVAGDWTSRLNGDRYIINPSALKPYAYRAFAKADPDHAWAKVVTSSYDLLYACSKASLDGSVSAQIPPNWCGLTDTPTVTNAKKIDSKAADYSYDAPRAIANVALDYVWYHEPKAEAYLKAMKPFVRDWSEKKHIYAGYTHDGKPINTNESLAQYGVMAAYFAVVDPKAGDKLYYAKISPNLTSDGKYMYIGTPDNTYDQHWAWLGTAVLSGALQPPLP